MPKQEDRETQKLSQLLLVVMIVAFSTLLIVLNILLSWEKWMIPLLAVAAPACLLMHILRRPNEILRTNICAVILLVQMFYYTSEIDTVYDGTGVIVVVIVVLSMTHQRALNWISYAVGNAGLIMHIINTHTERGLNMTISPIVRTVWCFIIVFIAAVVADCLISSSKKTKDEYEERIRESEELNRSAGDFLANVSHEIRTPINAVIGLSGVCIDRESDVDIRMDMLSILEAGKRVAEQVSDILDYSEIDRGQLAVNEEDYMISSVLNDLVLELRPYMRREVELVINVDPEIPAMMHTDVSKLKKILWHLIMNGIKYTKNGGVYVRIQTRPLEYGVNLFIEVIDTGIGMDKKTLERIFDRFFQSDSGRTRSSNGLGLGMPIALGFVRELGGFMTVESEPDKGTTVRVSIPQQVIDSSESMTVINPKEIHVAGFLHFDKFPHPQVREYYNDTVRNIVRGLKVKMHRVDNLEDLKKLDQEIRITHLFVGEEEFLTDRKWMEEAGSRMIVEVVAAPGFRLPRGSAVRFIPKPFYCYPVVTALNLYWNDDNQDEGRLYCPGVRALVVDDEPMNLTVAIGVFRGYGMVVETAESGIQAVEMCRKKTYDIVFMDHMMPGMDGVETMKRIRIDAGKSNILFPIVALTANAVSTAREMFMREGFDGFVSKPIDINELERVLKHVLPQSSLKFVKESKDYGLSEKKEPEANKEPATAESPQGLSELTKFGINPDTGLSYCQQDEEFYKKLLCQFAAESENKKRKMKECMDKEDLGGYAVHVHAIKSTAKMIGAADLSEKARRMEEAAKSDDLSFVVLNRDELMSLYAETIEGIGRVVGDDSSKADSGITDETDQVIEFRPESVQDKEESYDDEVMEFAPKGGGD